jgi:hypothetical protein
MTAGSTVYAVWILVMDAGFLQMLVKYTRENARNVDADLVGDCSPDGRSCPRWSIRSPMGSWEGRRRRDPRARRQS